MEKQTKREHTTQQKSLMAEAHQKRHSIRKQQALDSQSIIDALDSHKGTPPQDPERIDTVQESKLKESMVHELGTRGFSVEKLTLSGASIDGESARAILDSLRDGKLQNLYLNEKTIVAEGAEALAIKVAICKGLYGSRISVAVIAPDKRHLNFGS